MADILSKEEIDELLDMLNESEECDKTSYFNKDEETISEFFKSMDEIAKKYGLLKEMKSFKDAYDKNVKQDRLNLYITKSLIEKRTKDILKIISEEFKCAIKTISIYDDLYRYSLNTIKDDNDNRFSEANMINVITKINESFNCKIELNLLPNITSVVSLVYASFEGQKVCIPF